MLHTIFAAQRANVRFVTIKNWCAQLWKLPKHWDGHITNADKIFNVVETWAWASMLLGRPGRVAHVAWRCTICYEQTHVPTSKN
eukprot:1244766-Amphidinium_carterae.2